MIITIGNRPVSFVYSLKVLGKKSPFVTNWHLIHTMTGNKACPAWEYGEVYELDKEDPCSKVFKADIEAFLKPPDNRWLYLDSRLENVKRYVTKESWTNPYTGVEYILICRRELYREWFKVTTTYGVAVKGITTTHHLWYTPHFKESDAIEHLQRLVLSP